jgi:signal transduction histidine kinase
MTEKRFGTVNFVAYHEQKYEDPLFLVSNLDYPPLIIQYYKRRFRIETLFGNMKSRGFNIHKTKVQNPDIINGLILIVSWAYVWLVYLGRFAKKQNNYKTLSDYQQELLDIELALAKENYSKTIAEKESQLNVAEKDNQIKAQQTTQRFLWLGLAAAGLAIGLVVWFYQRLRKQRRVLAQQNDVIDRQNKELLYLDAAKTRFFTNISHELRTPLTLILGPLSILLKNTCLDNAAKIQANVAQSNAQNLLRFVKEILDLSKLESGKMQLQETVVRFAPFINRLFSAFESHAEYLGVQYQLENQTNERLQLNLDRDKFSQIVNNLLSNALKFTPRGGSVVVKVEEVSNVLRLSVSDTGRGIHPDDLPPVFDRFYQTNQAMHRLKAARALVWLCVGS